MPDTPITEKSPRKKASPDPSTIDTITDASVMAAPNGKAEFSTSVIDVHPSPPRKRDGGFLDSGNLLTNFVLPLLLIAAAVGLMLLLGTIQPAKRPPLDTTRIGRLKALAPVRTEVLQSLSDSDAKLTLDVDGVVIPFREARVAAEVAGRIVFKADVCEAGQYVKAGTLLMKIDNTDYDLEVERLTRVRKQEYQALQELDQEVVNTQRLIEVAEKDVALQRKEVDRQKSMPSGYASRADIDKANRALLAAQQQLVTAQNQSDLLKKRRTRLEASEQLAGTQLRAAEVNLARTEVKAPIDGVIVSEEADLNTFVSRGSTLLVIDDTSKAEVATSLRMDQLYWVLDQKGVAIDPLVQGYDLPETPAIIEYELSGRENVVYRWPARLLSYDGIGLDRETRTVPVRVIVDDPQARVDEAGDPIDGGGSAALVRGMYVKIKLLINPTTPLVLIPAEALQPGNRVYQFVSDDSVLDPPPEDAGKNKNGEQSTQAKDKVAADENASKESTAFDEEESEESLVEEDAFEPDSWTAGRVVVRSGIVPVDSIVVTDLVSTDADGSPAPVAKDSFDLPESRKWWVCEVAGQPLESGSQVVVSPMGTIDGGTMPARAMKPSEMEGTFAKDADAINSFTRNSK